MFEIKTLPIPKKNWKNLLGVASLAIGGLRVRKKPGPTRVKEVKKFNFAFLIKKRCKLLVFQLAPQSAFHLVPPSTGKTVCRLTLDQNNRQPILCFICGPWEDFHEKIYEYLDVLNKENEFLIFLEISQFSEIYSVSAKNNFCS